MELDYKAVGKRIRQERLKCNETQQSLAELIDMSTAFVGCIETGKRKMSLDTFVRIVHALGVPSDQLLVDCLDSNFSVCNNEFSYLMEGLDNKDRELIIEIVKCIKEHSSRER